MENLTKEQIERINEVYDSISGEGLTKEEIINLYGYENVEFIESEEGVNESNETEEEVSLEDKIEEITQYYEAAGFDIGKSKENFWRFLGI